MKKLMIIILILLINSSAIAVSWTDRWTINGVKISELKHLKPGHIVKIAGGAVLSFTVHQASHWLVATAMGKEMEFSSFNTEIYYGKYSDDEWLSINRAGFTGQLFAGSLLNLFSDNKYLKLGYNIQTVWQLTTYDTFVMGGREAHHGDFEGIKDAGGQADIDRALFTVWSFKNIEMIK